LFAAGGFEQGTRLCHSKRELAQEMAGLWRYLEAKYQRLTARHTNGVRLLSRMVCVVSYVVWVCAVSRVSRVNE
jgi:hypothetical protein